ncbi:MAG: ABC transporter permease subunit [Actinomycetales bacterium]|nr:ABC transporter permease subunit [Actinomycetales bacterium]
MSHVLASARHEVLCLTRERLPLVMLAVFVGMVSVSSLIGWLTNTTVSAVWEQTRADGLTQAGNPFDGMSPLYYARNTVIYVVLIGALMAIVVGVTSGMRDPKARTVDLVLTRPVGVRSHLAGKATGIAALLAGVLALVTAITWLSISIITHGPLPLAETARIVVFFAATEVLLMAFALMGMLSGLYASRETTALLVPISLWSIIVFVLPQIGTSQNPVSLLNPVPTVATPGGAFETLNTVVSPLSVTEQFKTAGGLILDNPQVSGGLGLALSVVLISLVAGAVLLMLVSRDRVRGALRD